MFDNGIKSCSFGNWIFLEIVGLLFDICYYSLANISKTTAFSPFSGLA